MNEPLIPKVQPFKKRNTQVPNVYYTPPQLYQDQHQHQPSSLCFDRHKHGENVIIKIAVLGESNVGKTTFLHNYAAILSSSSPSSNLPSHSPTIGIDFVYATLNREDMIKYSDPPLHDDIPEIKAHFWDVSGKLNKNRNMITTFIREYCGVILMFDISRRETFEKLSVWLDYVKSSRKCSYGVENPILLIGNKRDLYSSREVFVYEAKEYAANNNMMYSEISCNSSSIPGSVNVNIKESMIVYMNALIRTHIISSKDQYIRYNSPNLSAQVTMNWPQPQPPQQQPPPPQQPPQPPHQQHSTNSLFDYVAYVDNTRDSCTSVSAQLNNNLCGSCIVC